MGHGPPHPPSPSLFGISILLLRANAGFMLGAPPASPPWPPLGSPPPPPALPFVADGWLSSFIGSNLPKPSPHTHYSASSESSSRIDRGWTTAMPPAILLLDISSTVAILAEDNYINCISDHALVDLSFSSRAAKSRAAGLLPTLPS